jgi:hypothetical protein
MRSTAAGDLQLHRAAVREGLTSRTSRALLFWGERGTNLKISAIATCVALAATFVAGVAEGTVAYEHARVMPGSPLMKSLLRRPFPTTKAAHDEISSLLLQGGNIPEDEFLGQAEARAALHKVAGESIPPPATIGDAIDAERATRHGLMEAAQEVMERVVADYPPGPIDTKSERISESPAEWKVSATLRVTNGLEAPVSEAIFMVGPGDRTRQSEWAAVTCRPNPPLAPHATIDMRCEGGPRAFEVLQARNPAHTHTVITPIVWIIGGHPSAHYEADAAESAVGKPAARDELAESARAARAKLAAVPCAEKGSCGEIARAERDEWKKKSLPGVVNLASVAALVLSLLAATRRRATDREAWLGAIVSIALVACSCWILVTAMAATAESYVVLLGLYGVFLGAVPFLIGLAGIVATLQSGRRTPLRLFAVSFSALSSALLLGVLLLG